MICVLLLFADVRREKHENAVIAVYADDTTGLEKQVAAYVHEERADSFCGRRIVLVCGGEESRKKAEKLAEKYSGVEVVDAKCEAAQLFGKEGS